MKDFYLYHWIMSFFLYGIYYMVLFREGMYHYFRLHKISKTKIRKSTKGMKNYWWYEQLHEAFGFDRQYYLNKIFTIISLAALLLHMLFGWLPMMSLPIVVLFSLSFVVYIPMNYFALTQWNLYNHGQKFVFFARRKNGRRGYDCIFVDVMQLLFPILFLVIELDFLKEKWHFIK